MIVKFKNNIDEYIYGNLYEDHKEQMKISKYKNEIAGKFFKVKDITIIKRRWFFSVIDDDFGDILFMADFTDGWYYSYFNANINQKIAIKGENNYQNMLLGNLLKERLEESIKLNKNIENQNKMIDSVLKHHTNAINYDSLISFACFVAILIAIVIMMVTR